MKCLLTCLKSRLNQGYGVADDDPRFLLARRLRALRKDNRTGTKITQRQVARALGGSKPLSESLISSWESDTKPAIPPPDRLESYAALFATPRSLAGSELRLISAEDLSEEERRSAEQLHQELIELRNTVMGAGASAEMAASYTQRSATRPSRAPGSMSTGPWHFEDGGKITIVCAEWPQKMLEKIPYTKINDPDYIELLTYSDLDSLFMSYGHLRAANPDSQVDYFRSGLMPSDGYETHLVSLGGTDWNEVTRSLMRRLSLPVRQKADWDIPDGQFFEVDAGAGKAQYRALLEDVGGEQVLREDVGLFARAVNPHNRKRTATICSGMYGRGTYGVVRALTNPEFRDRNTKYLEERFGDSLSYCLLCRVSVENNRTITPDWTIDDTRLFEWPGPADAG